MMPVADLIALPYIARETYCHCIAHKTFHCSSGVPWSPTNYKCIVTIPGAKLDCKVLHRSIAKFQRQCPCKRVSIYQCIVYIHCASSIIAPMFWCALAVHQYIAIKNHCIHILTEMDVMILPV